MLCGRLYGVANRDIQEVRLQLAGNYPVDIVPHEWYKISLPVDKRGIVFTNVLMVCRSVTDMIDMKAGTVYPECVFEPIVITQDGYTDTYPAVPEDPNSPVPPYTVPPYLPIAPYTTPLTFPSTSIEASIRTGTIIGGGEDETILRPLTNGVWTNIYTSSYIAIIQKYPATFAWYASNLFVAPYSGIYMLNLRSEAKDTTHADVPVSGKWQVGIGAVAPPAPNVSNANVIGYGDFSDGPAIFGFTSIYLAANQTITLWIKQSSGADIEVYNYFNMYLVAMRGL
jgi:hypothetical protein